MATITMVEVREKLKPSYRRLSVTIENVTGIQIDSEETTCSSFKVILFPISTYFYVFQPYLQSIIMFVEWIATVALVLLLLRQVQNLFWLFKYW